MNSTSLKSIIDLDILPHPFLVKDKHVLLQPFSIEEKFGEDLPEDRKIIVGQSDFNGAKTTRAKVVGLPNHERGMYADGFALGDVVMIHEMVGNAIFLEGKMFRVVRAEDVVGWYSLGSNPPLRKDTGDVLEIPLKGSKVKRSAPVPLPDPANT